MSNDKPALRRELKHRIGTLDENYINESNVGILNVLLALPEFISAPRVFTYLSVEREVDTRAMIAMCAELGKPVAIPGDMNGGLMSFGLLDRPFAELYKGPFGIPVPAHNALRLQPEPGDIMIVPALCCTGSGYRLGHGGGYYDRYLSAHEVFSVCLCREKLILETLPLEPHDVPVNCVITEKGLRGPEGPRICSLW